MCKRSKRTLCWTILRHFPISEKEKGRKGRGEGREGKEGEWIISFPVLIISLGSEAGQGFRIQLQPDSLLGATYFSLKIGFKCSVTLDCKVQGIEIKVLCRCNQFKAGPNRKNIFLVGNPIYGTARLYRTPWSDLSPKTPALTLKICNLMANSLLFLLSPSPTCLFVRKPFIAPRKGGNDFLPSCRHR